jgi:hypothetical protein
VLYADCSWREMNQSHGPHNPPGYPLVMANRLVERGFGLEISVVTQQDVPGLPGSREQLLQHVRLSGEPHAVLVQVGAVYGERKAFPRGPRVDPIRWDIARRFGPHIFAVSRFVRPTVLRFGLPIIAYHGCAELDRFLGLLREVWPAAARGVIPPFPKRFIPSRTRRLVDGVHRDMALTCRRRESAYLDCSQVLEASDREVRCANGYNLNRHGSELVGDRLAEWMLEQVGDRLVSSGSSVAA